MSFTEMPGMAAQPELLSGNPQNLPHLVTGTSSALNRTFTGNTEASGIREHALYPEFEVVLDGSDVTVNLPANPEYGQRTGILFTGRASDQKVIIDGNGTAFDVLDSNGNPETQCLWDLDLLNSEAWFIADNNADNTAIIWRHA